MLFEYRASLVRVVDGDTIIATVDKGFRDRQDWNLRFCGVNAPEKKTPEGVVARQFVIDTLGLSASAGQAAMFTIRTAMDRHDDWDRYLCWVILNDGRCLNRMLIDEGHAVPLGPFSIDPPSSFA